MHVPQALRLQFSSSFKIHKNPGMHGGSCVIPAQRRWRQEDQFKVIYTESESVLVYIRLNLKERKRKETVEKAIAQDGL